MEHNKQRTTNSDDTNNTIHGIPKKPNNRSLSSKTNDANNPTLEKPPKLGWIQRKIVKKVINKIEKARKRAEIEGYLNRRKELVKVIRQAQEMFVIHADKEGKIELTENKLNQLTNEEMKEIIEKVIEKLKELS